MNKLYLIVVLLIIVSSCGTKKVLEIDYSKDPKNAKELIARVNASNNVPEWLSLRGKISLDQGEKDISLNITIKGRKDSLIWASVSAPFGIELFRAMLTTDSVYFLNRTNKTYFIKPVVNVKDYLSAEITFLDIQEMLTATPRILKNSYSMSISDAVYELKSEENIKYNITVDSYRILNASISNTENRLIYEFQEYINDKGYVFPRKMKLEVQSSKDFEARLNYSKTEFDKKQKITFKIPSSYVEVE